MTFDTLIRRVAGDRGPADGDLHAVWTPTMAGSAIERLRAYLPPSAVRGYLGGEMPETPCATGTAIRFWRENARYCPIDATILYDRAWLEELALRWGPFAPAAILSHEWGHHLQGFTDPVQPGIPAELEADCFAGMYLGATEVIGADGRPLPMRDEDLRTALTTFFSLGDTDYRESHWFQPGLHGSPQQRVLAFTTGYLARSIGRAGSQTGVSGLDWCLGYADFEPGAYIAVGPYRLLNPPGRPSSWADDAYVMPPRSPSAYPSSTIALRWIPTLEGGPATQEMLAGALGGWLPEWRVEPLGDLSVRSGTGVAAYVDGPPGEQRAAGVVGLVSPISSEGGLLVAATRRLGCCLGPAEEFDAFVESAFSVDSIVLRLCAPGESTDPTSVDHHHVCMTDRH